jgi:serine/threonine protein kinase
VKITLTIAAEIIYNYIIPLKMANVLRLAMGTVEFPEILSREEVLNRRQCENLLSNIQKGVEILQTIPNVPAQVSNEAHKDLFRIVNKGRLLIEECCNENWVDATVMQLNNKEWFRELLSDFESCFHTLCEISCHYNPREKERILAIKDDATFYPTPTNALEEDQTSICERLSKHLDSCNTEYCKDCRLVRYLEEYLRSLQRIEGGELDDIVFPYNYPRPKYGDSPKLLGGWNGGAVYLTNWLGVRCATKVIDIRGPEHVDQFWKEASILGGLNHPNIIKFLCCGFHEANNQFELVMEFGETTLSQHLSAQGPLEEMDAMDIMLQITKGMCYLHDMKVAHRDLKPANVVVAPSNDSILANLKCIDVKLLDIGISKVEVKDSPEMPTGRNIGTCGYMAPEAMAKELSEVNAFKADIFSFGMVCSDILSGAKPLFHNLNDYRDFIQKYKRPKLSATYSEVLRSLVHECWSLDPSKRPTFIDIYKRLARLKNAMLKGSLEIIKGTNDTIGSFWQASSSYSLSSLWQQWTLYRSHNSTSISSLQENCNNTSSCLLFIEVSMSLKL